jgi:heme exporter protein D
MNWGTPAEFFAMGGYGFYVWGSYLVTGACVAGEMLLLRVRRQNALQRVRAEKTSHEAAA